MTLSTKSHILFLSLNAIASLFLLKLIVAAPKSSQSRSHSYIGDDYPIELPLKEELPLVAMTLQETVHFDLNISDPASEREWDSLMFYPRGFGRVHLSPEHRAFNLVWWHQLHCLREMERGIQSRSHPSSSPHHIRHCLNYLRQSFLCEADHTLEKGDFMKRDFEMDRMADTRMCRDWETVESVMNQKMLEFFDWKHEHYLPS